MSNNIMKENREFNVSVILIALFLVAFILWGIWMSQSANDVQVHRDETARFVKTGDTFYVEGSSLLYVVYEDIETGDLYYRTNTINAPLVPISGGNKK